MTLTQEAELVQNAALGAVVLWAFSNEYCDQKLRRSGPPLPYLLPVLPMVFHAETVENISRRHFDGGLLLALAENRTLTLDLNERVQNFAPQTMKALNLAFATGLLSYNRESGEIWAERRGIPSLGKSPEIKPIIASAERLGYWFSTIGIDQLCSYLHLKF